MIFKVVAIGIVGALLTLLLRQTKPEFAALAGIGAGVVIVVYLVNSLSGVVLTFNGLVEQSGLPNSLFSTVLKIIGIGYLTEYSASVCKDANCLSIADKVQLGGKLTIFFMSVSVISSVVEVVSSLVAFVK